MGAWEDRRAALAELHRPRPARDRARREHEAVELEHPLLEGQDVTCPLDEQLRSEPVAPHHLDGQAADVADLDLALARQPASLAKHPAGRRKRRHAVRERGSTRRRRLFDAGLDVRAASKSSDPGHLAASLTPATDEFDR
jgi:hypothetical protein